jgi:RNA polymerase sigma-70 factor (ECF subfamily)
MNVASDRSARDFTQTRWSMVRRLQGMHPDGARDALADLAVRYWYPVYAYVRRCGHPREIAQDIAQVFLHQVAVDLRGNEGMPSGRFRDWLLVRLRLFLAGEWRDLVDGEACPGAPSLSELESRSRNDHAPGESPEAVYQRSFALEVLSRGLKRLRAEARETGHPDMYEILEPFLTREPRPGQYEELGQRLTVRPLVLVLALKQLRQRFRELVREELADTVLSVGEMEAEQRVLFAALGPGH